MVSKRRILVILTTALCMSSAIGGERTVTQVTVDKVGLNLQPKDQNLTYGCKVFRPTIDQIKRYFSKAYPVEGYVLTTERYSPCYATGTVEFTDNNTGRVSMGKFQLRSSGTATLWWSRGDSVDLLYKDNQWNDPFACGYGLGDEGEC